MARIHGRITKEDLRAADLRRWNGRQRVTTDWTNLFYEPELYFPNGDCLVYLREPGQSSRGPSFRIHTSQLLAKGFRYLVERCMARILLHAPESCSIPSCEGCDRSATRELYLPAPFSSDLDATIDYHVSTRNFFAWLYNLPLAGRALGVSFVSLKERLDEYRPGETIRNKFDITAYLEFHRYLDFRECVDHALAALHFAEMLELEDLWVDAFAHCVGLSHRDMLSSVEFVPISQTTKTMIKRARLEMDVRLDRVSRSVMNFFEKDLSEAFLGLPQAGREHFDRFRSFLNAFYIEQYGFWPPEDFDAEAVKKRLYSSMYSDFRSLYHHLVDQDSSSSMANVSATGGVCTLQNIQAFDKRHHYEALPHPLPMLPQIPKIDAGPSSSSLKNSFSSLRKRRADREMRNEASMQSLIESSNRDLNIMNCLIVRRYSYFEQQSVTDDFENVTTLISVMQAPQQVRNTEGLSYSLCCHAPKLMPWQLASMASSKATSLKEKGKIELEPDNNYSHTNSSSSSIVTASKKERRDSLPRGSADSSADKATPQARPSSLRRLLSRKSPRSEKSIKTSRPAFCEIYVQGYGNGLNEVNHESPESEETADQVPDMPTTPPSPATLVSRESSSASGYSSKSGATTTSGSTDADRLPDMDHLSVDGGDTNTPKPRVALTATDVKQELDNVHFNTQTWDVMLRA